MVTRTQEDGRVQDGGMRSGERSIECVATFNTVDLAQLRGKTGKKSFRARILSASK